jgi:erythromycin esterase
VWLAEGDNGGGSDVLAKTRLVRFLHEHLDFDVLAFQAGIHSSMATWRGLRIGEEPRAALTKSVFGALARSAEAEALVQYLAARARTPRPLEVAGFDSQFTGTAARTLLPELQTFLATHQVAATVTDGEATATRVVAGTIAGQFRSGATLPSAADQSAAVQALRETAVAIERYLDGADAARWAQIARSTAVQVDLALNNTRGAGTDVYMRGFIRQMGENLAWLATRGYAGRKIIVWSHTLHAIQDPTAAAATRATGTSVRAAMSETAGLDSFAIGLTSHAGRSHLVTGADDYYQDLMPAQYPPVDFETLMDAAGFRIGFVDLRSAQRRGDWPGGRFAARPLYLITEEADWSAALDALLFIRDQQPRTRVK